MPLYSTIQTMDAALRLFVGLAVTLMIVGHTESAAVDAVTSEPFDFSEVLDSNGNYVLFWNFNSAHVTFEVHVQTTGWVGFGLSENGNMFPSDVVIGWVDDSGNAHFSDRHANGHRLPLKDKSQDWHLLQGSQDGAKTILKFQRKIDTCDPQDRTIPENTARVIYAYNDEDPVSDDAIHYHGSTRGTKSVSLLSSIQTPTNLPSDVKYIDILSRNYLLPPAKTTYHCFAFKMPDIGKHHMIKFEPIVTPGNEGHVHHFVLSRCNVSNPDDIDGIHGMCYDDRPKALPQCNEQILAWAVGGEAFYFPESVGFSMGGPEDGNLYVLEIHYDNPSQRSGVIDNSGIRLTLTSSLRAEEAGMLMIGDTVTFSQLIPPGRQNFVTVGMCNDKCIQESLESSNLTEINIFAIFQHSHLIGREIRTRHFRNGTEIEPLQNDPFYDFNFQETRKLPKVVKVRQGDSLSVDCVYDSTSRVGLTFGGLSTSDEMCLSFIYYYPKFPLSICTSRRTYNAVNSPPALAYHDLVSVDWSNQTEVAFIEEKIERSKIAGHCIRTDQPPNYFQDFDSTMYKQPFVAPQTVCTNRK
uniref:Dopamine beta-hydroxylase n=1 Tax=Sinonovacula constricta TaxID=98310 RepID=A0A6G7GZX4_SINCO|nr:dopamine beta-hydroxylase [Sinonovacula constricta]